MLYLGINYHLWESGPCRPNITSVLPPPPGQGPEPSQSTPVFLSSGTHCVGCAFFSCSLTAYSRGQPLPDSTEHRAAPFADHSSVEGGAAAEPGRPGRVVLSSPCAPHRAERSPHTAHHPEILQGKWLRRVSTNHVTTGKGGITGLPGCFLNSLILTLNNTLNSL